MPNVRGSNPKTWDSLWALGLFAGALLWPLASCHRRPAPTASDATAGVSEQTREDLLIGYTLLADTLAEESRLGTLDFFKTLMFDAPNDAIGKIMKTLSDTSKQRASELSKLRRLAPDVSQKPTKDSPIGEAITAVAKEFGKSEMLSRSGGFDVRFVLVQAQATRMVAAMATATARFDPNAERKTWLRHLAAEYERYRGDLIQYLGGREAGK